MALNSLFSQIVGAVTNHADQQQQTGGGGFNPGALLGQIQGLFGQHAAGTGQDWDHQAAGSILPSSQDPYGDPAGGGGGILSSSQDPYGDPANGR